MCGGTGITDTTVPTNTLQVPKTTGTVTDSGSEYTGFISDIGLYIQDRWIVSTGQLTIHVAGMLADQPGTHVWGGRGEM